MIRAIEHGTEEQDVSVMERMNDTPFPLVVDNDDNVIAVVMVYGQDGLELARVVASAIQEYERTTA